MSPLRVPEVAAYDVVVVGYGMAGGVAAIAAADAWARVLLVEKMPHLGGTTLLSSGYLRVATDANSAAQYLSNTSGGRVDDELVAALARGMVEVPDYLIELGGVADARVHLHLGSNQEPYETSDLYQWPGRDALGWAGIARLPGFEGYPWVFTHGRGELLMRTLEVNIAQRLVDVWLGTPARRLIRREKDVIGVVVERQGRTVEVHASGGVILACGGFEFNARMLRDFLEVPSVYPIGHPGNTGDGIVMAQEAGAALWHMWHIHGSYGFNFPNFPVAMRNHLGGSRRAERPLAWILVDQHGARFMNELPPAPQDTTARPLDQLNAETGQFDRMPSWMIFDDAARLLGPLAKPAAAVPEHAYLWSPDNSVEVSRGWILAEPSLEGLAARMRVQPENLIATIATWNAAVAAGRDTLFGRPPRTMLPVATSPFYAAQVWPIVSNTQGGPRHDAQQRVLDPFDTPIPGLYAAGELGSFFGHIYLLGGNLTEGMVGGRIAGRHAAQRALARNGAFSVTGAPR